MKYGPSTWEEDYKIIVWMKSEGELISPAGYGNNPQEVVKSISDNAWYPDEVADPKVWMAAYQRRSADIFLYYDEESFLQALLKCDALHIEKWDWDVPHSD